MKKSIPFIKIHQHNCLELFQCSKQLCLELFTLVKVAWSVHVSLLIQTRSLFNWRKQFYELWKQWFEFKNILMDLFVLPTCRFSHYKTVIDGLESCCELLWCFYQLFGLSFWRHPFTAEHPLVSKWYNAKFPKIYSKEKTNSSTSWMNTFSANYNFGVNCSFNIETKNCTVPLRQICMCVLNDLISYPGFTLIKQMNPFPKEMTRFTPGQRRQMWFNLISAFEIEMRWPRICKKIVKGT